MKRKTYKLIKAEKNRVSILTDDLEHCIECGNPNIQLHEVFFGKNRQQSIIYGCVIPLCDLHHTNNTLSSAIHYNNEMCLKWHKKAELEWVSFYDKNEEDFIKVFGKSYLDN